MRARGALELPDAERPRRGHRAARAHGRAQARSNPVRAATTDRRRRLAVHAARGGARRSVAVAAPALSTVRLGCVRRDGGDRASRDRAVDARRAAAVRARAGDGDPAGRGLLPVFSANLRPVLGAATRRAGVDRARATKWRPAASAELATEYEPAFRVRFEGAAAAARACTSAARCSTASTASRGAVKDRCCTAPARSRCWGRRCATA